MTPIGSTSSNIRRAIEFMGNPPPAPTRSGHHDALDDRAPRNSSFHDRSPVDRSPRRFAARPARWPGRRHRGHDACAADASAKRFATMDEFVPLVAVEDLPPDLRAQYEATARPGLRDFIRLMAHAPDQFRRYNDTYSALRFDNHLGARVTELVRLATAQTTRCPVCMAGRHPDAIEAGLTEELVAEIGSDQPTLMTPAEVAAVRFALKFAADHLAIDAADKAALR